MATVNIRCYSEPDTYKEFSTDTLLALMDEHRDYLASKGVALPARGDGAEIHYEQLALAFLDPDVVPPKLVERLHLVKQMSSKDAMDRILDRVKERKLPIEFTPNSTAMDIAAQFLLKHEAEFRRVHAEKAVARYRGLTFFVGRPLPGFTMPKDLSGLEATLNDWYEAHQRGRTVKLLWRQKGAKFWIYIRHAEPLRREGCIELSENKSGSMMYWPEKHDLVIFDPEGGEMGVHGDCKDEPELFRQAFGEHLCGNKEFFPLGRRKYTLDPLKKLHQAALVCAGIEGLEDVTLTELEYIEPGDVWGQHRIRAEDVFAHLESKGLRIPQEAEMRQAKFAVKFRDARKVRIVVVRPSNYAQVGQDDDAMILEAFFERQGFHAENGESHGEGTRSVA